MDHDGDFSAYATARWGSLVRSGIVLGCTLDDAQDLAQTTLLRCYTAWRKVQRAENRDAYVYKVLLNSHRDSRRRRWWGERPASVLPDRGSPDDTVEVENADAIRRALADLSPVNREVVVLRYYAHLTERQTADLLHIAPGTVKSRLSRALTQLADSTHLADLTERPGR
jgi:RNA polymerase sigma-70 factor (sigma-E family)